jgi:hypothetical protein
MFVIYLNNLPKPTITIMVKTRNCGFTGTSISLSRPVL